MGLDSGCDRGAYIRQLADHARELQGEARAAFAKGEYTRASFLLGDAELLADDVHDLVRAIERREIGGLMPLAAYDVRSVDEAAPPTRARRLNFTPRVLKVAIGTGLTISIALTEF